MSEEKYLGRIVKSRLYFTEPGTFQSMYAAQKYLKHNSFGYGSNCTTGPTAFMKGEYELPQKWYNINEAGKELIDGVMVSDDFREGTVTLIFFEPIKIEAHE